jgi:hypothetical protein
MFVLIFHVQTEGISKLYFISQIFEKAYVFWSSIFRYFKKCMRSSSRLDSLVLLEHNFKMRVTNIKYFGFLECTISFLEIFMIFLYHARITHIGHVVQFRSLPCTVCMDLPDIYLICACGGIVHSVQ